jgi:hypothetical protein
MDLAKRRVQVITLSLLVSFLVCLFFIKGAQPPFGDIYVYLVHNFAPFRVFRSPDTKFSPVIIFSLCMLLLFAVGRFKKNVVIAVLLIVVVVVQSYPVLSGLTIRGENRKTSSDRIISISSQYKQLADYLNSSSDYGYIIILPPDSFAWFDLGNGDKHFGQDLVPKLTRLPVVYMSEFSGMTINSYRTLNNSINTGDEQGLDLFPIKYFVIRKDIPVAEKYVSTTNLIKSKFKLVFSNNLFEVYQNIQDPQLIKGASSSVMYSPIKYEVELNPAENKNIILNQNFNRNWLIYKSAGNNNGNFLSDIKYVFEKPVDLVHTEELGYANNWVIPSDLKNGKYIIYYKNQALFYLMATISVVYVFILSAIAFILSRRVKK